MTLWGLLATTILSLEYSNFNLTFFSHSNPVCIVRFV
nr:MAG TPA: hypothetical protein [Caudoviricetes sp.]